METVEKIMGNLGAADIDSRLEEQLIDGILYAFQEQTTEDVVMLNGFGTIVNSLSKRVKPYLPQICGTILWRLNNKSAKVCTFLANAYSSLFMSLHSGSPASRRFNQQNCSCHEDVSRRKTDGSLRCCALRIPRRRVPRSVGLYPWRS